MNSARELHELLAREGYRPTIEDLEGGARVSFKSQGDRMSFESYDNDPTYVYLIARYTADGYDHATMLEETNRINVRYKSVKATLGGDPAVVTFTIEAWYQHIDHVAPVLGRWIAVVTDASNEWFGRVRETGRKNAEGGAST